MMRSGLPPGVGVEGGGGYGFGVGEGDLLAFLSCLLCSRACCQTTVETWLMLTGQTRRASGDLHACVRPAPHPAPPSAPAQCRGRTAPRRATGRSGTSTCAGPGRVDWLVGWLAGWLEDWMVRTRCLYLKEGDKPDRQLDAKRFTARIPFHFKRRKFFEVKSQARVSATACTTPSGLHPPAAPSKRVPNNAKSTPTPHITQHHPPPITSPAPCWGP